jgi:hypothetical protein
MSTERLEVEVLRSARELEAIEGEWLSCYEADRSAAPYASYAWTHCLATRLLPESRLRVCIVRRRGEAVAILPLALSHRKISLASRVKLPGPLCLHWAADAHWLGGAFSTRNGAVVREAALDLPVVACVLRELGRSDPFRFVRLEDVPSAQAQRPFYSRQVKDADLRIEPAVERDSVQIRLAATWPEYCATLSGPHRKAIARRSSALRDVGEVQFRRLGLDPSDDPVAIRELLEDAVSVSRRSWQARAGGLVISSDAAIGFVREVSVQLARVGALDLSVLYLDEHPISFLWGVARWPFMSVSKSGFDVRLRTLSPGVVHRALHIQDSIARHGDLIDVGPTAIGYKAHWGKEVLRLSKLTYYPPGMVPTVVRWGGRLRAAIRRKDAAGARRRPPRP